MENKTIDKIKNKITELEEFLISVIDNQHDENLYFEKIQSAIILVKHISSEERAATMNIKISNIRGKLKKVRGVPFPPTPQQNHIAQVKSAISYLKVLLEEIEEFGLEAVSDKPRIKKTPIFVSKSFSKEDEFINNYIENILKVLKVPYKTGERYSSDSLPEKIESRIVSCDLLLCIATKRDKLENGPYQVPEWISREVYFAKGKEKDLIVLQEEGTKDLAGLRGEKEILYFNRDSVVSMMALTIKLLEALKEHKLI